MQFVLHSVPLSTPGMMPFVATESLPASASEADQARLASSSPASGLAVHLG